MRFLEAALRKFAVLRGRHRTDLRNHPAFSCVENGQHQGRSSFARKQERLRQKLASAERRKNIAAAKDHRSTPIAVGLLDAIQDIATDYDTRSLPDGPGCRGITAAKAWNTPDVSGARIQVLNQKESYESEINFHYGLPGARLVVGSGPSCRSKRALRGNQIESGRLNPLPKLRLVSRR